MSIIRKSIMQMALCILAWNTQAMTQTHIVPLNSMLLLAAR